MAPVLEPVARGSCIGIFSQVPGLLSWAPTLEPTKKIISFMCRGTENYLSPSSREHEKSPTSSPIHPYGRNEYIGKLSQTISAIVILWPVEAMFEKKAATVEVDAFITPGCRNLEPCTTCFSDTSCQNEGSWSPKQETTTLDGPFA